jgi:ssDNA-binding Zn-finger/Zn-ribbon topoisomerase 1
MNKTQLPTTCPNCGKPLRERKGKYGPFLGCMGYPECNFTFDLSEESRITCPICDKKLKIRLGRINKYLSCSGYPECTFNYFPDSEEQEFVLSCPDCKNDLFTDKHRNLQILCKGCKFTLSMNRDDMILCPNCNKPLTVRTGTYGRFLGCTGYPDCRFASNLEHSYTGKQKKVYCSKCGSALELISASSGDFLRCTSHPKCDFTYILE